MGGNNVDYTPNTVGTTTTPATSTPPPQSGAAGQAQPGTRGFADGNANGTHYRSAAALADQGNAFRSRSYGGYGYHYSYYYTPSAYAAYPNAWQPTNVVSPSLYTHPGYGALAKGLGLAAEPNAMDYGGNVVVQADSVYVNGDSAGTTQEYADQASQIAAAGATDAGSADTKWLPLGVFAVVEGDATSSDDNFQLAVDQAGVIRGNYHNLKSDAMEPISGSVDKTTQRAAWTIGGDQMPVYESGVANLTQDQTPILVHTADGQTRQLTLIRLEEPAEQPAASTAPTPQP